MLFKKLAMQSMRLLCSFSKPGVRKKEYRTLFFIFFFGYSPPVTSYSLRGLLFFCNSYWDLLSVTVFNIISYEIMAKYFQNFAKRDTFQFGRRLFFYLETEWFLPIMADKYRKSDWNWKVWLGSITSHCSGKWAHTKQRPLWFHVSFFTHFNQPLTINNIATLTRVWNKKNLHISMIPRRPSVRSDSVLFSYTSNSWHNSCARSVYCRSIVFLVVE